MILIYSFAKRCYFNNIGNRNGLQLLLNGNIITKINRMIGKRENPICKRAYNKPY